MVNASWRATATVFTVKRTRDVKTCISFVDAVAVPRDCRWE
jgi:hypothetical protein